MTGAQVRRVAVPAGVVAVLLTMVLAACTGSDEPGSGPTAGGSTTTSPEPAAEQLTAQLLEGEEAPEPVATVAGTFLGTTGESSPVEVDVLQVRAGERSTLLRWRLRSASGQPVNVRSSALSRPAGSDTRAVVLVDEAGDQRLQPFTYVPQKVDDGRDLFCVCSGLPIEVGEVGELMYALYPPLDPTATTVDVLIPDVQQAEDVELQSLELDGFPTALLVSYDEPGPTAAPVPPTCWSVTWPTARWWC